MKTFVKGLAAVLALALVMGAAGWWRILRRLEPDGRSGFRPAPSPALSRTAPPRPVPGRSAPAPARTRTNAPASPVAEGADPWEAGRLWAQEYRAGRISMSRLVEMLRNPDEDVSHAAAVGLVVGAGREGLEQVAIEIRRTRDADHAADLAEAGEEFQDRAAAHELLDGLLKEKNEFVTDLLEEALAAVADPSLIDDLYRRQAVADENQAGLIADTLRQVDDAALAEYLLEVEVQSRPEGLTEWREALYDALASMGTGPAAARLLSRMSETAGAEAVYLGQAIRSLHSSDARPVLFEAAGNRSGSIPPLVRIAAFEALAGQTDPSVGTWLSTAARDEADPEIAAAARKSLDAWRQTTGAAD